MSSVTEISENKDERFSEIEERLYIVRDKIMNWEDRPMIWDWSSEEAEECVEAVYEARRLTESLKSLCFNGDIVENELLWRARDVLHMAMVRLEEEFTHILVQYRLPFESTTISCSSSDTVSFEDDLSVLQSINSNSEECSIDLINPDVIPDLQCIAHLMFDSNYIWECTDAFINSRKDVLYDLILEVENLRIEDMPAMESATFDTKIKRCTRAMRNFVLVYLSSEKWLSDQIFGDLDSISSICFAEASKASMLQLLSFGKAIAYGPHRLETSSRFLDMYELLTDLSPQINALYANEFGFDVRSEWEDFMRMVCNCVKRTFLEIHDFMASNLPTKAVADGQIHHLTRYIMNHINALTKYTKTLDLLLTDPNNASESASCCVSPMALHIRSVMSDLECKLDDISKLYQDDSLRHFFLMNNTHYMALKVQGSKLRTILGKEWIREQYRKSEQQAMDYEGATWSSVLSLLKDEGIQNPGSNSISRTLFKVRLRRFYSVFEESYKREAGWLVGNNDLWKDLQITVAYKVIEYYGTFLGSDSSHLNVENMKYAIEDLENYILEIGCL
ncbi:hypothetical protein Acr_02g0011800 [Actinidia rufa]|uniref:Exocyst subunit Exo70 family protein n=1 Tax=Actinidia rufa TaxID=165716 RepID=A0A7J0E962_9ERIC|nr:hypothetical protein Acr_02g0011800 [Actinidia rufa]